MRGERGQITIFFAIGLVLLIVVGIMYLVLGRGATRPLPTDTGASLLGGAADSCLDTIVKDELESLGRSGLLLPEPGYPSQESDGQEMLVAITKNSGEGVLPLAYPAPRYPDYGIGIANSTYSAQTGLPFQYFQDGYFGDVNFPPLCSRKGPNAPGTARACRSYPSSPPGSSTGVSVQQMLEEHIAQRLPGCVDARKFGDALGITVDALEDPSATLTFSQSNVVVEIAYPMVVQGATRIERFGRRYDVRFLPLAQFAIDLARAETRNVTFDPIKDGASLPSYRSGFTIHQKKGARYDVYSIFDGQSEIDGITYGLSFLVEHRPPMIDELSAYPCVTFFDSGAPRPQLPVLGADPDGGPIQTSWCGDCDPTYYAIAVRDQDQAIDWAVLRSCTPK